MNNKTAMRRLVDEIDLMLQEQPDWLRTGTIETGLKAVRYHILDSMLDQEKDQIIEAFKNASNEPGEAEKYYEITYKNDDYETDRS